MKRNELLAGCSLPGENSNCTKEHDHMIEVAKAINSFLPAEEKADSTVLPSEDTILGLTYSQLQELIKEAIQPVQEEVSRLREEVDQDRREIEALRAKLTSLESVQEQNITRICLDIAYDRQRLTKLERANQESPASDKKTTKKTEDHIQSIVNALHNKEKRLIDGQAPPAYLRRHREEGMTFSALASLLGLTVDRIRQLSRIAATDNRLVISWHPRKKNTKIIRLSRWDAPGL